VGAGRKFLCGDYSVSLHFAEAICCGFEKFYNWINRTRLCRDGERGASVYKVREIKKLRFGGAGGEGFGAGLHGGDAAAAFGGAFDHLFDVLHPSGEIHFAAEGFYVGLDFGVLKIHFLAGVVDEGFGDGAVEDEGAEHVPVTEDLEDVGGVLVAFFNAVDEVVGGVRSELSSSDVGAGLAHYGFAAKFVEAEDEFGLVDGGSLFWHEENLTGRG
jgi:hypothetical protein